MKFCKMAENLILEHSYPLETHNWAIVKRSVLG